MKILLSKGATKYTTPRYFFDSHIYFFRPASRPPLEPDNWVLSLIADHLDAVNLHISQVSTEKWTEHVIRDVVEKLSSDFFNAKLSGTGLSGLSEVRAAINRYFRWALAGGHPGPGIPFTMAVLGREFTIKRLEEAIAGYNTLKGKRNV